MDTDASEPGEDKATGSGAFSAEIEELEYRLDLMTRLRDHALRNGKRRLAENARLARYELKVQLTTLKHADLLANPEI